MGECEYCENNYYIVISLFCTVATALSYNARFGRGEGPVLLDNLQCTGKEESLLDCCHGGRGRHSCGPYEDASVICYTGELIKWKNHFFRMKGDAEMGWSSKKERNKEWYSYGL